MTEIKNVKVYGLEEAMYRSGFPMRTSEPVQKKITKHDIRRSINLANTPMGSGHMNFLKGIIVQFDIKYPQYLTPQLQRYHWFEIISSQSKMHCLVRGDFKYNEYVDEASKERLGDYISLYTEQPTYENFMRCVSNCPLGLELWMGITTNYLQLKTIYNQRLHHKLKEDYRAILDMIEGLPYSEELILVSHDEKTPETEKS